MTVFASVLGFEVTWPVVMLGVVTGMLYGILAGGLVLVYRTSKVINFAHGEIGAFGAALLAVAVRDWGVPYWIAFAMALVAAAGIGAASEVVIIRRLRGVPLLLSVIATLGLGQVLDLVASIINSSVAAGSTYPQPSGLPEFSVGALLMTPAYTAMLVGAPVIVLLLATFLRRGRLGIALRASAANPDAALMSGMLVGRLSTLAWGMAGVMAAVTAVWVLPTRGVSSGAFLGPGLLLRGLACAVVGGMVSLPTALAAGISLGVIERILLATYPSGGQVEMVIFTIVLIALLLRRARMGRAEAGATWSAVQAFPALPAALRQVRSIRNLGWTVAIAALVAAIAVPELGSNGNATTFALIGAFGIVGLSVAVVSGLGGQLSLGQFALAGVGATVSYRVTANGAPFLVGLLSAVAVAAAVSVVVGLPALRIRGLMLAVTTLGFALAAETWLLPQPWMLGNGLSAPRPALGGYEFNTGKRYYLVVLAALAVSVWVARNIWASGVGRRIRAVRDNEDAARAFTVPAIAVKLQTFVLAGGIAGLGGAVYGHLLAHGRASAFPIDSSINVAVAAAIGGVGILVGPILGAFYIIGIPRFLPLDNAGLLATGAGWLLLLLQFPGGLGQAIAPMRDRVVDLLARRAGLDPAAERHVTPGGGIDTAAGLQLPVRPPRDVRDGTTLLEATGLTKRFGGLVAVRDVDVAVRAGEILGVIGPNGAGKTTLFELLGGFTRPDAGSITFAGHDFTRLSPERRGRVGLIRSFQDAALFPTMTAHEAVMVALERVHPTRLLPTVAGLGGRAERRKAADADDLLAALGLRSYRDTQIAALSTGTRRIAEIACLIALEPVLLLLDEPTSGIAQRETEALANVLRNLNVELDLTLVIIEHDIPMIMGVADRVMAMEAGQVVTVGTPDEVQSNPQVIASYLGTDAAAIERSTRAARAAPAAMAVLE